MSVLVIAEAGVNHDGDLATALALIDVAAAAGADVVKFQTFNAKRLATRLAGKAAYQLRSTSIEESQQQMLQRLELTEAMHEELMAHCALRSIGFLSTAFDLESLDYLARLGLERFKVPSGELTNLLYLRQIGGYGKPLYLSTGMATVHEIGEALDVLEAAGTSRDKITVMHCSTEYPTPMEDVNLRAMTAIRDTFGVAVGYSDHTRGIEVPIAAVALGAEVVEKHFTLDRARPGPDHAASMEPDELEAMVRAIRNIEVALGDGVKRPRRGESANIALVRKSLVAARAIEPGELFSPDNVTAKRPGSGISPMRLDEVLGRPASRRYEPDDLIEL